jgi:hypothetical protein
VWSQSTTFEFSELTNEDGMVTISSLAWKKYKYMIKDGMFITKDIAILKAKLTMFDFYFSPGPYDNKYHNELLYLESQIEAAKVDLHMEIEKNKRIRKILALTIPTSVILFTALGFTMGMRFSFRIN